MSRTVTSVRDLTPVFIHSSHAVPLTSFPQFRSNLNTCTDFCLKSVTLGNKTIMVAVCISHSAEQDAEYDWKQKWLLQRLAQVTCCSQQL